MPHIVHAGPIPVAEAPSFSSYPVNNLGPSQSPNTLESDANTALCSASRSRAHGKWFPALWSWEPVVVVKALRVVSLSTGVTPLPLWIGQSRRLQLGRSAGRRQASVSSPFQHSKQPTVPSRSAHAARFLLGFLEPPSSPDAEKALSQDKTWLAKGLRHWAAQRVLQIPAHTPLTPCRGIKVETRACSVTRLAVM